MQSLLERKHKLRLCTRPHVLRTLAGFLGSFRPVDLLFGLVLYGSHTVGDPKDPRNDGVSTANHSVRLLCGRSWLAHSSIASDRNYLGSGCRRVHWLHCAS